MNLNTYLDYTTSQSLTCGGHVAHLQASAIAPAIGTLLLVIQGRATRVRALWVALHEKALIAATDANSVGRYFPRAEGKVYLADPTWPFTWNADQLRTLSLDLKAQLVATS